MTKRERDFLGWLSPEEDYSFPKKKRKPMRDCWGDGNKEWSNNYGKRKN